MPPVSPSRSPRPPVRDRLLAVADQLFYAEGIHVVGIDRLLAEAGVAKASLYQHFSSKDDLVAAYLQRRLDLGQDELDRRMAQVEGTSAERIVALFEILGKWMAGRAFRGCPFINAAAEYPQAGHPVQKVIAEHRARTLARFRALVADLGTDEPEALAESLMLLYDGALVAADLGSGRRAGRSVVTTVRRLLGAGACASPS
jgi:AcrR family transcriptional regulator